jgi:hypothetical protein
MVRAPRPYDRFSFDPWTVTLPANDLFGFVRLQQPALEHLTG